MNIGIDDVTVLPERVSTGGTVLLVR